MLFSARRRFPCLIATWFLASIGFAGSVVGQVPDSTRLLRGTLIGHVSDTAGASLADVEVIVTSSHDSAVIRSAVTNVRGDVVLGDLPSGTSYTVLARKIGYRPAQQAGVSFRGGDTLGFILELRHVIQVLPDLVTSSDSIRAATVVSDGLIIKPFSFLKCFAVGIEFPIISDILSLFGVRRKRGSASLDYPNPYDCSEQAEEKKLARQQQREAVQRAKTASRKASKVEREIAEAERRIAEARQAGRPPKQKDVLRVLQALPLCGRSVPDGALCRNVITSPGPRTLDSLFRAMAASGPMADSTSEPERSSHR